MSTQTSERTVIDSVNKQLFIGGEWRDAKEGGTLSVEDPATSPDGTQDWMTYHANSSTSQGCDINRTTRAQRFTWIADGTPNLGVPIGNGVVQNSPSGEPTS